MAITIIQAPLTVQPLANGANYLVNTNYYNRTGLKFLCDVYVDNVKVASLKNNKNFEANNYGVFDVSRVVENFVKTDINNPANYITSNALLNNINAMKSVTCKFGETFERYVKFNKAVAGAGTVKLLFSSGSGGSDVLITPGFGNRYVYVISNFPELSGWREVVGSDATSIRINVPWQAKFANASGLFYEGELFVGVLSYIDPITNGNLVSLVKYNTVNTYVKEGDTIYVNQMNGVTVSQYQGEAKIIKIIQTTFNGQAATQFVLNKSFTVSTNATGNFYSPDPVKFEPSTTSPVFYGVDAAIDYLDYPTYNFNFYKLSSLTVPLGKFLTNKSDRSFKVKSYTLAQTLSLYGVTGLNSDFTEARITSYSKTGMINQFTTSTTSTYGRHELQVSPRKLGSISSLFNSSVNNQSMVRYTIQMMRGSSPCSEIFTFYLDYECSRYDDYIIKFKNRLGGWDYHTFTGRKDRLIDVERSNIRKKLTTYNANRTRKYGYDIGDRGLTTFNVKANDKFIVNSGYLNNSEAQWLEELFTSPEVYRVVDNGNTLTHIPITLTQTDYEIGTKKNVGLITYTLEFQASYNKTIQRA